MPSPATIAYLAQGKLYIVGPDGKDSLVESSFVEQLQERTDRNRQRNSWRSDSMSWNINMGGLRQFGQPYIPVETRTIAFRALAAGHNADELFYSIVTDSMGGVFRYEAKDGYEQRLLHRNALDVSSMAIHPKERLLAVCTQEGDGTSHIGLLEIDRRGIQQITEGDAVDECPAWRPDGGKRLLYQSAGIARGAQGFPASLSPFSIHQVDVEAGKHELVLEQSQYDCLLPRIDGKGNLLYIRRPYEPLPRRSVLKTVEDILFLPYRAGRALVYYLHFLSLTFSGKPLITSGGPRQEGPAPKQLFLWGRMIQARKAMRGFPKSDALVGQDWKLQSRSSSGEETTLASHVVWFDLNSEGAIVYTDGRRVFSLAPDGKRELLAEGHVIEKVALLGHLRTQ